VFGALTIELTEPLCACPEAVRVWAPGVTVKAGDGCFTLWLRCKACGTELRSPLKELQWQVDVQTGKAAVND